MPVILPSRSSEQIKDILAGIQVNSLYPYSFRINRTFTNLNFPTIDTPGSGQYCQFIWTPTISIGITHIEGYSVQIGSANYAAAIVVSLNSVVNLGDSASLTIPSDEGNIIYQSVFNLNTTLLEHRFTPQDYFISANTPIYISFWILATAIGQAGSLLSSVIIHSIPIGTGA